MKKVFPLILCIFLISLASGNKEPTGKNENTVHIVASIPARSLISYGRCSTLQRQKQIWMKLRKAFRNEKARNPFTGQYLNEVL